MNSSKDAYQSLIDHLVAESHHPAPREMRSPLGTFWHFPKESQLDAEFQALPPEAAMNLAWALRAERIRTTHRVLAILSQWRARGLELSFKGQPLKIDRSGMGMEADYAGRMEDWEWPEDAE